MNPSPFQKRICWSALTALAVAALTGLGGLCVYLLSWVVGYLQPVLIPVAVSVVLAYLLEPCVAFLCRRKLSRTVATLIVFLTFFLFAAGVLLSVIPTAARQGSQFVQNFPVYSKKVQDLGMTTLKRLDDFQREHLIPEDDIETERDFLTKYTGAVLNDALAWLQERLPYMVISIGNLLQKSLGGVLGVFGLAVGLILIPIFLFYLLRDAPAIVQNWQDFLPMRASPLKTEVVSLLLEINGYIIAFFRGQILVSVIDGTLITLALLIMGLDFAILIGLMVAILGIIPYAGTLLTWGPAALLAVAQYGDWMHPLIVTAIFVGVHQLDGFFITPWIVGESVGLHSLTVMVAVLAWTVILGGLLGALLAVPLTAALKVVARRYLWDRPAGTTGILSG